jgi:hypothetical protein
MFKCWIAGCFGNYDFMFKLAGQCSWDLKGEIFARQAFVQDMTFPRYTVGSHCKEVRITCGNSRWQSFAEDGCARIWGSLVAFVSVNFSPLLHIGLITIRGRISVYSSPPEVRPLRRTAPHSWVATALSLKEHPKGTPLAKPLVMVSGTRNPQEPKRACLCLRSSMADETQ